MPLDLSHPRYLAPFPAAPSPADEHQHKRRAVHLKLTEDVLKQLLDSVAAPTKGAGPADQAIKINLTGPNPVRLPCSPATVRAEGRKLTVGYRAAVVPHDRPSLASALGRARSARHDLGPPLFRLARPRPRRPRLSPRHRQARTGRLGQGRSASEGEPRTRREGKGSEEGRLARRGAAAQRQQRRQKAALHVEPEVAHIARHHRSRLVISASLVRPA